MLTIHAATEDDCLSIYNVRNSKEVSRFSFDSSEISFESHQEWFLKSLQNPLRKIFVIQKQLNLVSTVRFDLDEQLEFAIVSIFVNPVFWGQGVATFALIEGEKKIKEAFPSIKKIKGEVLYENNASRKLFEKCSYDVAILTYEKKI